MREHLAGLQLLRGVACLLVVSYHLAQYESRLGLGMPYLDHLRWFGYAGVDLFFVLSGFVIAHAHRHKRGRVRALPGYLARRVWRIFPAYWAALALGVGILALCGLKSEQVDWAGGLPGWLTLLPLRGNQPNMFVPPAWSLTFELLFYVAFALTFLLPRLAGIAAIAWAAAVIVAMATGAAPNHPAVAAALSGYVLEFLAGVLLASYPLPRPRIVLLAAIAWLIAGSFLLNDPENSEVLMTSPALRVPVFGPAAIALVAWVVAAERAGQLRRPAWLARVGDASYSIYLLHMPIAEGVAAATLGWPRERAPHAAWCVVMFSAMIGGGFLLYYAVERPLLRRQVRRAENSISNQAPSNPTPRPPPRGGEGEPAENPMC